MSEYSFSYGYYDVRQKRRFRLKLPYSPLKEGFKLTLREPCCMHFENARLGLKMKIRTASQYLQLYDMRLNPYTKSRVIRSHERLQELIQDVLDTKSKSDGN